ncbi:DUF4097 family beta strand repeat-containing protein [Anaerococcus hydrogenalis]|uniref:DUF4097 family beta strand repeat-containing protein n=1 Tax=Anaerococcus hydrogenalis TaxID=33029 RepID=UPI00288C46DB|nr:DUF4097 family beta strand repeat-containing protein [Anaerococcus hydrogenalis]
MSKNKKNNSFKLDKKQIGIGVFALIILALIFFLSKNIDFSNNYGKSSKEINENSYNSSKIMRVDLDDLKSIDFDLNTCDVRIQKSSTNPYVEYTNLYRDDYSYEVKTKFKDGNLKLSSDIKGKELYMKNKIQIVRIFLPKNKSIESIKGRVGAGDIKISDLNCKDMDLNLESGNISFNKSKITGSVTNDVGSILVKNSEVKDTNLKTRVGNIILKDSKLKADQNLENENGDIEISTKDSIKSFNINAKLNVGNFVLGNVSYRNILDGYSTGKDKNKSLNMKTKIGDILINKGEGSVMKDEDFVTSPNENSNDLSTPLDTDSNINKENDNTKNN